MVRPDANRSRNTGFTPLEKAAVTVPSDQAVVLVERPHRHARRTRLDQLAERDLGIGIGPNQNRVGSQTPRFA